MLQLGSAYVKTKKWESYWYGGSTYILIGHYDLRSYRIHGNGIMEKESLETFKGNKTQFLKLRENVHKVKNMTI